MTGHGAARSHVLIHDYAGHPATVEFARHLARQGRWQVSYAYFVADGGPKGDATTRPGDPDTLRFVPLSIARPYSKTHFLKRRQGDLDYGTQVADWVQTHRPDLVISGNMPTEAQERLMRGCMRAGAGFIYWCQDVYGVAAARILSRKLPGLGHLVGWYYSFLERRQMRRADHVVHITDGFFAITDAWNIPRSKISVIGNWSLIDQVPVLPRDTNWARGNGFNQPQRVIYSGTLADKHNPILIERLAREMRAHCDVVVVGVGTGFTRLRAVEADIPALHLRPLQPFALFAQVLASADVLIAVIEREAGTYSVPSKVLSYLCAGRPIVLAAPADNLAARIVRDAGAGIVVEPEDVDGFVRAVQDLLAKPEQTAQMGAAGRAYAQKTFDLNEIATCFGTVFDKVMTGRVQR